MNRELIWYGIFYKYSIQTCKDSPFYLEACQIDGILEYLEDLWDDLDNVDIEQFIDETIVNKYGFDMWGRPNDDDPNDDDESDGE